MSVPIAPSTVLDPATPTAAPAPIPDPTPPVLHQVAPYTPDELNSRIIDQSLDPQRLGATLLSVRNDHDQLKATVSQIAEWVNTQIQGGGIPPSSPSSKRTAAK